MFNVPLVSSAALGISEKVNKSVKYHSYMVMIIIVAKIIRGSSGSFLLGGNLSHNSDYVYTHKLIHNTNA